jgi:hypothetical protein
LQRLPRSYRLEHSLEDLITELRARLAVSRESALEAMVRIESDPIDLTDVVAYARRRVSRKTQWEALAIFASLMPPLNYDRALAEARQVASGSISHIFSSATYTGDEFHASIVLESVFDDKLFPQQNKEKPGSTT